MRIFTSVWGAEHISWFRQGLCRSLRFPGNLSAINDARWTIQTKNSDIDRVFAVASKIIPASNIEFLDVPDELEGSSPQMGAVLLQGLLYMVRRCLDDNAPLLTAPPDTIFGEGSIQTLKDLGKQAGSCVAVAHPRVLPRLLNSLESEFDDAVISNTRLVEMAMENLHDSWLFAEVDASQSNSFIGGVSWRQLTDKLYAVQHRLPTCYLSNFIASDLTFFQQPHDNLAPTYGAWDHAWPGKCLIPNQRQRLVGASDAAFVVELTDPLKNIPPLMAANPFEPDAFWRNEEHNKINRQTVIIFRKD